MHAPISGNSYKSMETDFSKPLLHRHVPLVLPFNNKS